MTKEEKAAELLGKEATVAAPREAARSNSEQQDSGSSFVRMNTPNRIIVPVGVAVKKLFNEQTEKMYTPEYDPSEAKLTAYIGVEDDSDVVESINFTVFDEAELFDNYADLLAYVSGRQIVFKAMHTVKSGQKLPYDIGDQAKGELWAGATYTACQGAVIL